MKWETANKQTFGCEIEMNNIERKRAARLAAEYLGTNNYEYTGTGYDTWTAYDAQGREWKFMSDSSIAGPQNERCEMVTPILTYEADMETLQGLVRTLRAAGAVSHAGVGCGVHIHIGADGHTGKTLRNLVNLMASHEDLLDKAIGIDPSRKNYCNNVKRSFLEELNRKKPETIRELQDIWYEGADDWSRRQHYHSSRYRMLNLHALQKGTVEFRMFQFDKPDHENGKRNGLHAGKLRAYVMLALVLSQQAKEAKTISAKPVQMENEKFAMRTWMNRMGMIGPEFKAPHEHFLTKLDGDAAWRYGRPE